MVCKGFQVNPFNTEVQTQGWAPQKKLSQPSGENFRYPQPRDSTPTIHCKYFAVYSFVPAKPIEPAQGD